MKKNKISFAIHENLKKELQEQIIKDGYGLRGKSKWICEAVIKLFDMKEFGELIKINDEMSGFNKMESFVFDARLKIKIHQAIIQIREKFPTLEGVQSRIFRTAIIQRILRT